MATFRSHHGRSPRVAWADLRGEEKLACASGWAPDAPDVGPCRWQDYAGLLAVWEEVRLIAFVAVPEMDWWAERLRMYVEAHGVESLAAVKWGDPGCLDLDDETEDDEDGGSPPNGADDGSVSHE